MFLEILLFIFVGIAAGVFAGLMPGIHPNNLIWILLGILPLLLTLGFTLQAIVALIVSMVVANAITSFIPSIFLGAPEDSTALSVLPGHRLLLEGKGLEAIYLTIIGGVGVVILFVLLMPLLLIVLPIFYSYIRYYIPWILICIASVMVLDEEKIKKLWGLVVFLLAGLLGMIVLNSTLLEPTFLFFPLFTGLFGISTLLISLGQKAKFPKQAKDFGIVKRALAISGIVKGFFAGLIVGILPAVGAAQAGTLVQIITRKEDTREFLVGLGGINTSNSLFALLALYTIGRLRSGAAVAVERILGSFVFNDLLLLVATILFTAGIVVILTLYLSKKFLSFVEK
ncbi:MAG: tripartite tricarboxylate transporter permease, partial [Candidatus Aenigmarchaeota archaeon]|nr:tripartite tricarboxylate transporter permease [Candidatus Aenigmarchaeota archaeon]